MSAPADSTPTLDGPGAPAANASELSRADFDALYDFALTVTWDPSRAADAVVAALTRRGASEPASIAGTFSAVRDEALRRATPPPDDPLDLSTELPPPESGSEAVEAISLAVIDRLPAEDRAVLDLALRKELEGDALAEALGVAAHEAADTVAEARGRADAWLRNYVLARIGHDICARLDAALEEPPNDLSTLSERVDTHVDDCSICDDRRRGLVAPTTLLHSIPPRPVPEGVLDLVAEERGLDAVGELSPRSRWVRAAAVFGVVVLALAGVALGARIFGDDDGPTLEAEPAGRLRAAEERLDFAADANVREFTLQNPGQGPTDYEVRIDVPWLGVSPLEGVVEPGSSAAFTVTLDRTAAPEGSSVTTIRIVTEGGIVEIDVAADVSRNPVVSAVEALPPQVSPAPCEGGTTTAVVSATVVEESGLRSVTLKWSGPADPEGATEGSIEMQKNGERHEATLGPWAAEGAVTWTVEAVDTGGNLGASEAQTLTVTPECVVEEEAEDEA